MNGSAPNRTIDADLWKAWVEELRQIAQIGLQYSASVFDAERYERIRQIAAAMAAQGTNLSFEQIENLYSAEEGYPTPKLFVRCAVFSEGRILLVHEKGAGWSLPGGWVDACDTVGGAAVREVKEEAGLDVTADYVIAVQDRDAHHKPYYSFKACKVFVMCTLLGGEFRENSETDSSGFFAPGELPDLDEFRTTREQVEMCFRALQTDDWRAPVE